jgi:hypothetical protein
VSNWRPLFIKEKYMEKKSFMFYVSWNEAIKKMDETQLRRFINNLCNYAEGKEIIIDGLVDEIMWSQVKPLLDYNETKRQKRIENGKKGGAPTGNSNAEKKSETTKNNLNQTKQPKTSVEGRTMNDEGRTMNDEGGKMDKVELVKLFNSMLPSNWSEILNELGIDDSVEKFYPIFRKTEITESILTEMFQRIIS